MARRRATQRNLSDLGVSARDIEGYWAYEHIFDEIRRRLRTRGRDTWLGETPTREEIEDLLHGEQAMIDIVFTASSATSSTSICRTSASRTRSSARA